MRLCALDPSYVNTIEVKDNVVALTQLRQSPFVCTSPLCCVSLAPQLHRRVAEMVDRARSARAGPSGAAESRQAKQGQPATQGGAAAHDEGHPEGGSLQGSFFLTETALSSCFILSFSLARSSCMSQTIARYNVSTHQAEIANNEPRTLVKDFPQEKKSRWSFTTPRVLRYSRIQLRSDSELQQQYHYSLNFFRNYTDLRLFDLFPSFE